MFSASKMLGSYSKQQALQSYVSGSSSLGNSGRSSTQTYTPGGPSTLTYYGR